MEHLFLLPRQSRAGSLPWAAGGNHQPSSQISSRSWPPLPVIPPEGLDPVAAHRAPCHPHSPHQKPCPVLGGGGAKVAGEEGRDEARKLKAARSCVLGRLPSSPSTPPATLAALFVTPEADLTGATSPGEPPAPTSASASSVPPSALHQFSSPFQNSVLLNINKGPSVVGRARSTAVPAASSYQPWSEAQMRILAHAETQLPPGDRMVNAALAAVYQSRSLDAIKALRRQPRYRAILAEVSGQSKTPASLTGPAEPSDSDETDNSTDFDVFSTNYAYEMLASYGLDSMGLAANATQVPISSKDIGTILAHFGVRAKRRKAKTQAAKPAIRRLPGERSRVFKRRLYREHQRLYALGPGVLLEELVAATGTLEVGIAPSSLPKHCKHFSAEEVHRALKAMAPRSAPGPDGLTVTELRRVPPEVLALLANNFLSHHHLPEDLQVQVKSFARLQRLGSPMVDAVLEGALDGFRRRLEEKVGGFLWNR
ncbi:hypothetical protein MTO96_046307 [Rhipicephalus appendiculatus]